jgi:hypothetical protein
MKYLYRSITALVIASVAALVGAEAPEPVSYLEELDQYPQLSRLSDHAPLAVRNHLVPLGAIEKIRGVWAPRDSERYSGTLQRFTWQVLDGFTSAEVMDELQAVVADDARSSLVFACEARGCGSSVQWANRIFQERLLYGTEKSQRYAVYLIETSDTDYRLLIYASARTADRQYLHAELLATPADAREPAEQGGS